MKIEKWDDVHGNTTSDDRMVAFLESSTDSYAVLQLKHIDETDEFRFMPYWHIQKLENQPTIDHYYVDAFGFVELQDFMKPENYLKNAEMAMEDDYGMLDGIINNGKAPAAEDRPSVLEQLKEMSVFDTPHKPPRSHPERDME